jgi:hypothetical protein
MARQLSRGDRIYAAVGAFAEESLSGFV